MSQGGAGAVERGRMWGGGRGRGCVVWGSVRLLLAHLPVVVVVAKASLV